MPPLPQHHQIGRWELDAELIRRVVRSLWISKTNYCDFLFEVNMIGIYLIKNMVNDKLYIGQSNNIQRRWWEHTSRAFNPNAADYNTPIHSAIRKYGAENFEFKTLMMCEESELDAYEQFYIKQYATVTPHGYNLNGGGQRYRIYKERKYCKCGKQIRDKKVTMCRECYTSLSKIPSKSELQNRLVGALGNFTSVALYFGVSTSTIRRWCTKHGIASHSKDFKVPHSNGVDKRKKAVLQIDPLTNSVIGTFDSADAAARFLGKRRGSHITDACRGNLKHSYGYIWKYKD